MVVKNGELWDTIKKIRCDFLGYCSELSGKNGGRLVGHHIHGRKNGKKNGNGKKKPRKRPGPPTIWDCQMRLLDEESERHHKLQLSMGNDDFSYEIQRINNAKLREALKEVIISNPLKYPRPTLMRIRGWLRDFPWS
ncbi:MAG: hypothetical protein PHT44_02290 [Candidatus Portnoybacteria bacterium]|nr:hypothetical protein [Candidatus Portnoybacteria bacterium]MDD4982370.1 hypothetical protein [Candidatus Portnoybacteria bacterium]